MKNIDDQKYKKNNFQPSYFSKCFHRMREEKDLTQGELAECLGISRQSVNAIEKGKSLPSMDLALNIADFFQKNLNDFFRLEEEIENSINNIRKETNMNELLPFRSFRRRGLVDDLLDDGLLSDSLPVIKSGASMPTVDFYETDHSVVAEFHMPGFSEEDVSVEVDDKAIYVTGERKEETEDKKKNYYYKETSYGKFSRAVAFPVDVVSEKADAEFNDGVLKVVVPKVQKKKAKILKVKVNKKK
jgi:HSP20 family protein